jgi:hypothetical protein
MSEVIFARWCGSCNAEEAITSIEVEMFGRWIEVDVGPKCLTKLQEQDMIEE